MAKPIGYLPGQPHRRLWLDAEGRARIDRRRAPRDNASLNRVWEAYRFLRLYTNPIRGQMPLSTTEVDAAKAAARILIGKGR